MQLNVPHERAEIRGRTLDGRYRVGEVLGIGGTAVAFEAVRLADGENVVVKVLRPSFVDNPDLVRRLRREGEVARTVPHPAIVQVLDEGVLSGYPGADGSPYLVLERIHGECLQRVLRRVGVLTPEVVGALSMRVATILHAAHQHGYVHRDVKPEHIFMDRAPDGSLRVRLLDFGVCASARAPKDERDREVGRVFGTPSYCSPEQASGNPDVDARADVFGLGIVMFEAVTGRLPFSGSNVANLLRRIIREDAPRAGLVRQDLSFAFDEVIARSLARDPEDRFHSMRAFSRAMSPLVIDRRTVDRTLLSVLRLGASPEEGVRTRPDVRAA
ncbi:MAG: serine/threonine protein kinase [Sandaracinaceae bacterium]|nr:serine/threonine protein kinase [Sandaracinaceae bacterium]